MWMVPKKGDRGSCSYASDLVVETNYVARLYVKKKFDEPILDALINLETPTPSDVIHGA